MNFTVFLNKKWEAEEKLSAKTVLMLLIHHAVRINLLIIVFMSIKQSFSLNSDFQQIFLNAMKVVELIQLEFNVEANFASVRRLIWKKAIMLIGPMLFLQIVLMYLEAKTVLVALLYVSVFLPYFFFTMIVIKFNFYVMLTNVQLKMIDEALQEILTLKFDSLILLRPFAEQPADFDSIKRKLLIARKAFNIISINASLINDVMGFGVLQVIVGSVIESTIMGYQLFKIILDAKSVHDFFGN